MKKGVCYGVSVGPGGEGLITLDAVKIIKDADLIFLPSSPRNECRAYVIARKSLPDIDEKEIISETFTMSRDSSVMTKRHDEIAANVMKQLDMGLNIAFLTLGEVGLYSTYMYIHDRLTAAGYRSVLVPGISSPQAALACLNMPLAIGDEEVHIFPDTDKISQRLNMSGTKIFMKPKGKLEDAVAAIRDYCRQNPEAVACGISNCGMTGEIIAWSADELCKLNGYFTLLVVKSAGVKSTKGTEGAAAVENCETDSSIEQMKTETNCSPAHDYFENHSCKYYPCHEAEHINCLFCYCPMYSQPSCPGNPTYIDKGDRRIKNCSGCTYPHKRENYANIMKLLR